MSPRARRRKEPASAAAPAQPDGYEGLDWHLHAMARAGRVRTAVGPGLVQYGLWMHVVQSNLPKPADPDVLTGAVLQ